jgi:hypothetical protein
MNNKEILCPTCLYNEQCDVFKRLDKFNNQHSREVMVEVTKCYNYQPYILNN